MGNTKPWKAFQILDTAIIQHLHKPLQGSRSRIQVNSKSLVNADTPTRSAMQGKEQEPIHAADTSTEPREDRLHDRHQPRVPNSLMCSHSPLGGFSSPRDASLSPPSTNSLASDRSDSCSFEPTLTFHEKPHLAILPVFSVNVYGKLLTLNPYYVIRQKTKMLNVRKSLLLHRGPLTMFRQAVTPADSPLGHTYRRFKAI